MKSEQHETGASFLPGEDLVPGDLPAGVDRRAFMRRSAVIGGASEGGLAVSLVLC